jgi:hypothetical protein
VPLTKEILEVIDCLPRFKHGKFLFSTTLGASPVWMGSKVKERLDGRMLRTLKALATKRGEDPSQVRLLRSSITTFADQCAPACRG